MPTIEERVAYLEGRFGEHTQITDGLHDDISDLRDEMNRRFGQVDKRFDQIDGRLARNDDRIDSMDAKIDRHFTWLVGLQMATLLAVVGAVLGAYFK